ncbi:MAG: methylenetetrahydrofolate reductase, partial [Actinomycetota bacterium]
LAAASRPLVSVEIIPPRRGGDVARLEAAVESLLPYDPAFIDITSHAAEVEVAPDGSPRRAKRRAPGTFGLCAAIRYRWGVDPVPHVLCNGFTAEETEDALIELDYLGVENLMCLRGDGPRRDDPRRTSHLHASDLVAQVAAMNRGEFLDGPVEGSTDFCIGVAAYPEKHLDSPSLEADIEVLRRKQELGAHYAVTQLFFDVDVFLAFVARARDAGVTIPILPGLKILTAPRQLEVVPKVFGVAIPDGLRDAILGASSEAAAEAAGIAWARAMTERLLAAGSPLVHFYVMQNTAPLLRLLDGVAFDRA